MYDKLIYEISKSGRKGYSLPNDLVKDYEIEAEYLRENEIEMPEVSEVDVVRH